MVSAFSNSLRILERILSAMTATMRKYVPWDEAPTVRVCSSKTLEPQSGACGLFCKGYVNIDFFYVAGFVQLARDKRTHDKVSIDTELTLGG